MHGLTKLGNASRCTCDKGGRSSNNTWYFHMKILWSNDKADCTWLDDYGIEREPYKVVPMTVDSDHGFTAIAKLSLID